MNKEPVNQPQEVDLLTFFRGIGNFFKSIGRFIYKFFYWIFEASFVKPFYYLVKFKKIILPLFVMAFVLGIFADMSKKKLYKAEILLTPYFDSGKELYTTIDFLNNLIAEGDTIRLAEKLNISPSESASLIAFEIEPNYNERINIKHFDEYVRYVDTLALENITYSTFVKSFEKQKFDYPQHKLSVIATDPYVFHKLNPYFDNLLEDNADFLKKKKEFIETAQLVLEQNFKALQQIDSLRRAVDTAIKNLGKSADVPGGSVIVGTSQINFPEIKYDLFENRRKILQEIQALKDKIFAQDQIIQMNSTFPETGEIYSPISRKFTFLFLLGLWVLLIFVANLIDFIGYLNKRAQEKLQQ
jgi:hypothetical protein